MIFLNEYMLKELRETYLETNSVIAVLQQMIGDLDYGKNRILIIKGIREVFELDLKDATVVGAWTYFGETYTDEKIESELKPQIEDRRHRWNVDIALPVAPRSDGCRQRAISTFRVTGEATVKCEKCFTLIQFRLVDEKTKTYRTNCKCGYHYGTLRDFW